MGVSAEAIRGGASLGVAGLPKVRTAGAPGSLRATPGLGAGRAGAAAVAEGVVRTVGPAGGLAAEAGAAVGAATAGLPAVGVVAPVVVRVPRGLPQAAHALAPGSL